MDALGFKKADETPQHLVPVKEAEALKLVFFYQSKFFATDLGLFDRDIHPMVF